MKSPLPIAVKFLLVGIVAVMLGVLAVSAGYLWRAMLVGRVAQASYRSALAQAVQMEMEKRSLDPGLLSGERQLGTDEITAVKMRYRSFEVPLSVEGLPVLLSVARIKETSGGGLFIYNGAAECLPRVLSTEVLSHKLQAFALFALGAVAIGLVLVDHQHCETGHY